MAAPPAYRRMQPPHARLGCRTPQPQSLEMHVQLRIASNLDQHLGHLQHSVASRPCLRRVALTGTSECEQPPSTAAGVLSWRHPKVRTAVWLRNTLTVLPS
jgi:hypothetical protein